MKSVVKTVAGVALALGVAAVPLAFGPRRAAAQSAPLNFNITLTGASKTLAGQTFHYSAKGTMTYDPSTGAVTVDLTTNKGSHLTGTGTTGIGSNRTLFTSLDVNEDGAVGTTIITGKVAKNQKSFTAKFTTAIPDRLGAAPGGFVISTGNGSGKAA